MTRYIWQRPGLRLPIVGALALAIGIAGAWLYRSQELRTVHVVRFANGTQVFFRGDTHVESHGTPGASQELRIDGDALIRVPVGVGPLSVRTRLFVLTVSEGSELRVTAFSRESGEQTEVLHGHVEGMKAYASALMQSDTLTGGEMLMVNRDIDLMEKEKFDPAELKGWIEALTRKPLRDAGRPSTLQIHRIQRVVSENEQCPGFRAPY